jgi:hypothetical protein
MSASKFLVARIALGEVLAGEVTRSLTASGAPYIETDALDFPAADLDRIFALYQGTYARFAPKSAGGANLNVPSAEVFSNTTGSF